MDIQYTAISDKDDVGKACELMLSHNVYHPCGRLQYTFLSGVRGKLNKSIVVTASIGKDHVGVAHYFVGKASVAIYVKEPYRRKGIGQTLIRTLREQPGVGQRKVIQVERGFEGDMQFFKSANLMVMCNELNLKNVHPDDWGKAIRIAQAEQRRKFKTTFLKRA